MKRIISFQILLSFLSISFAQSAITGVVLDEKGEAVPFANAVLYSNMDSQMVKAEITDMDGQFRLRSIPAGEYFFSVSFVGYADYSTSAFRLKDEEVKDLGTIQLATDENVLDAVEVVAQRALIEVQPDKTVFNVEGSTNATGNTAMELMRKAPGVTVDNNDNIILMGKNGTMIYIDGKPSPLSGADLAALLNSMQSSEIEAIEIITNPSAKYDAEGDAGIINIRLKKNKSLGANANINANYNQGFYAKYNGSATMNYRNKFMNVFGTYSLNAGTWRNWMDIYREQNDLIFDSRSVSRSTSRYNGYKLGADFYTGEKSTLGFIVSGGYNNRAYNTNNTTPIADLATGTVFQVLDAGSDNSGTYFNNNVNLNYRFDNREGISWNIDADYGTFRITNESYQPNFYVDPVTNAVLIENIFETNAPTNIDIISSKVDHERPLWGGKLSVGAKFAYVITDNTFDFYNVIDGEQQLDLDRSNNFVYEENVDAAYVSFVRDIKKWGINAGLRSELTHSIGTLNSSQDIENQRVERTYLDLFPSGGVSYRLDDKNQLRLNYSRRIQRPNYDALNPFEYRMDELTYRRGNPFLQPQYTNSLALSHTFNYSITTSLNYSYTKDFFSAISDTTEGSRTFLETRNLGYQETIGLNISAPYSIAKWWSTYTNMGLNSLTNGGALDGGREVSIQATSFSVYHQSTFNISENASFEISGWYSTPSVWGALYKVATNWSMDIGFQQRLFDKRGNLKLSFTDVFNTAPWDAIQDTPGLFLDVHGGWESQQIRLSFSYMLGNQQVKGAKNRKTSIEDASDRVGGGNGN